MKKILQGVLATSLVLSMTYGVSATSFQVSSQPISQNQQVLSAVTLSADYAEVGTFYEGLSVVKTHDGKLGIIDHNGTEILEPTDKYAVIGDFSDGFATFDTYSDESFQDEDGNWYNLYDVNSHFGYLNTSGEEVLSVPVNRDECLASISGFSNGYGIYTLREMNNGGYGDHYTYTAMDTQGNVTKIYEGYGTVASAVDDAGYLYFYPAMWVEEGSLVGFIDVQGNTVIPGSFWSTSRLGFQDGLCAVMNEEGLWGFIDTTGKLVIDYQFDSFWDFSEGFAGYKEGDLVGVMNQSGTPILAPQFTGFSNFSDGFALVYQDGKAGLINSDGQMVIPHLYDATGRVINGNFAVGIGEWINEGTQWNTNYQFYGKMGISDTAGNLIVPMEYDRVGLIEGEDKFAVEQDGVYSILSLGELLEVGTPEEDSFKIDSWATAHYEMAEELGLLVDSLGLNMTNDISRLQIADLLVNMVEKYTKTTLPYTPDVFTDTDNLAILKACEVGIITGRGNGIFDPEANASRQEMALMTYKAILKMEDMTGTTLISKDTTLFGFGDQDDIKSWASDGVQILANNSIMTGSNGNFTPNNPITIQEALVVNNNLYKLS